MTIASRSRSGYRQKPGPSATRQYSSMADTRTTVDANGTIDASPTLSSEALISAPAMAADHSARCSSVRFETMARSPSPQSAHHGLERGDAYKLPALRDHVVVAKRLDEPLQVAGHERGLIMVTKITEQPDA